MSEHCVIMHREMHKLIEDFSAVVGNELKKLTSLKCLSESAVLADAMSYCLSTPGKCLRAFLASSSALAFGVDLRRTIPLGVAIEVIHSYSLVHDDLPSIDNSDSRRGKNSCHKEYGEAIALLVGDALLTLTFELLAALDEDSVTKCELIRLISQACGCRGMIAGQALDIQKNSEYSLEFAKKVHSLKTARLFSAACESGAILAGTSAENRKTLASYGVALGNIFQAKDDLCDIGEDEKSLNIARIVGVEETNRYVDGMLDRCNRHLDRINADVSVLRGLITFVGSLGL
ncbi:MAG: polyprenyl synthetase family protein [Aaplasma endosymbiont of Hyalomma asiaticum]